MQSERKRSIFLDKNVRSALPRQLLRRDRDGMTGVPRKGSISTLFAVQQTSQGSYSTCGGEYLFLLAPLRVKEFTEPEFPLRDRRIQSGVLSEETLAHDLGVHLELHTDIIW